MENLDTELGRSCENLDTEANLDVDSDENSMIYTPQVNLLAPWSVLYEMKRIQELLCKLNYSISHVYREANYAAD